VGPHPRGSRPCRHPRLELIRAPPAVYRVEPPGKLLHKHIWNESGDGCWDCLLALGRAGTPVYRLPYLDTDVAMTFSRELLEGLVLEVREVDGKQIGYLRLVVPEDLSTPIGAPSLAVAEQFDAEARAAAEDPGTPGEEDPRTQAVLDDVSRHMAEYNPPSEGVDLWPGSSLPPLMSATTKARIEQWMKRRADPEPRGESYTLEQEAEVAEQAERFQGLDDSDRE
jgi:hypothetical protein